jgi:transposase-like protein
MFAKGNRTSVGNKGGTGRPPIYQKEFADQANKLVLLGLTDVELAAFFGVSEVTINSWKREHREFFLALKEGKELADGHVARKLYHRATGYSHEAVKIFMPRGADEPVYAPYTEHYPPDTQAAIRWLMNRQPKRWREKAEDGDDGLENAGASVTVNLTGGFAKK